MQVILLEKIGKLGDLGDQVNVKAGYGRNYLIPYGKALPATKANIEDFESRKAELIRRADERRASALDRATALEGLDVTIAAKAGDEGKLYGSIGTRDIADLLNANGANVEKSEVRLPAGPIRTIGEYEIDVQLLSDLSVTVKVGVIAED